MATTYVLVADGGRATIYSQATPRAALLEVAALERPEARLPARELTTDLTGRVFDRVGSGRHGADSDYDPHAPLVKRLARTVAKRLTDSARQQRFDRLVLIAAPKFLGILRPMLADSVRKRVVRETAKDMTHTDVRELRRQLAPSFVDGGRAVASRSSKAAPKTGRKRGLQMRRKRRQAGAPR